MSSINTLLLSYDDRLVVVNRVRARRPRSLGVVDHEPRQFAGLNQAERPLLFEQIAQLDVSTLAAAEKVRFSDNPGWLISDFNLGRQVLAGTIGVKSRPGQSRRKVGGVGAMQGV